MSQSIHYPSIGLAAFVIGGLPTAWNIVARNEFHNHTIERALGSKLRGAYAMAAGIFAFSRVRDLAFEYAMKLNPSSVLPIIGDALVQRYGSGVQDARSLAGKALLACGGTLVMSSFMRLGVTGTFLGDYFGIKMKERITSFPFNVVENPMYVGATMNYMGLAMLANSGVGAMLVGWVAAVYYVATKYFEGPFTAKIYAEENAASAAASKATPERKIKPGPAKSNKK